MHALVERLKSYRVNPWVVAALLLLSVVLGVLNNLRVYEEQRVPWPWEDVLEEEDG